MGNLSHKTARSKITTNGRLKSKSDIFLPLLRNISFMTLPNLSLYLASRTYGYTDGTAEALCWLIMGAFAWFVLTFGSCICSYLDDICCSEEGEKHPSFWNRIINIDSEFAGEMRFFGWLLVIEAIGNFISLLQFLA